METTLSAEQVIEANRMIAEFMGAKHGISINHFGNAVAEFMDYAECDIKPDDREDQVWMHHVFYHTSWDWLMPAIKKFRCYLDSLERSSVNHCCKGDLLEVDITCALTEIDIEKAFAALIPAIQWHKQSITSTPIDLK